MKKHTVFAFLLPIFCTLCSMENPQSGEPGSSEKNQSIASMVNETLGAILFSDGIPVLSSEFCDQVICSAPSELINEINLLLNPETRNKVLPDNIILHGPTGSGKTTLAQVIAQSMNMPFMIVRGGMLGNEYINSAASGLRRIGILASNYKANVIIDELDALTAPKKKGSNSSEQEDETPKALWQLLDELHQNNLLFIGTSNNIKNMPRPLQNRFEGSLYEVPLLKDIKKRTNLIGYYLRDKAIDNATILEFVGNKTSGFSNREISKLVSLAYKSALLRRTNTPIILLKDFQHALDKLKKDKNELSKTEWDKKEIFNYTVQTIGAAANIVGIINSVVSIKNSFETLKLTTQGLLYQQKGIELQDTGIDLQKKGLHLQERGIELQAESLLCQEKGMELQNKSFAQQEEGLILQHKNFILQDEGQQYQKSGNWIGAAQHGAYLWLINPAYSWVIKPIGQTAGGLFKNGMEWTQSKINS